MDALVQYCKLMTQPNDLYYLGLFSVKLGTALSILVLWMLEACAKLVSGKALLRESSLSTFVSLHYIKMEKNLKIL